MPDVVTTQSATPDAVPTPVAAPVSAPAALAVQAVEQTSLLGATPAQADVEKEPEAPAAPEKYEFKAVDGFEVDAEVSAAFGGVAKELGMSLENAQKVLDKMAPAMAQRQQAQLVAAHDAWLGETKAHPEFGGAKFDENMGHAQKAVAQFGNEQFRALLNATGLGSHPEVFAFMARAGKALAEDKILTGAATNGAKQSIAQRMYPNMNP